MKVASGGPPIASCISCPAIIGKNDAHWMPSRNAHGQILALFPFCDACREKAREALERERLREKYGKVMGRS